MLKRCLFAAAVAGAMLGAAAAQSYPERPIKLIVPFPAGGVTDVSARLVANQMSKALPHSIVVENRGGGGGTLGATIAARAEPDGYTLFFGTSGTLAIVPALREKLEYDPITSFAPIGRVASSAYLLVVNADLPVKTVRDLVDYAKANPGKLNFGAPTGTPSQILALLFRRSTGPDVAVVPYKGGGPAMADLASGQVQAIFQTTTVILPLLEGKRVRILAIAAEQRSPLLSDVPTMREVGFPESVADSWNGMAAPAGTPQHVIVRMNKAINEALQSAELKASFAKLGIEAVIGPPEEFAAFIRSETKRWAEMVNAAGVKKVP
jgi:tripartite-type tricarboxylate transporter receptor subunit TctC